VQGDQVGLAEQLLDALGPLDAELYGIASYAGLVARRSAYDVSSPRESSNIERGS
jgi:hypothetical protein